MLQMLLARGELGWHLPSLMQSSARAHLLGVTSYSMMMHALWGPPESGLTATLLPKTSLQRGNGSSTVIDHSCPEDLQNDNCLAKERVEMRMQECLLDVKPYQYLGIPLLLREYYHNPPPQTNLSK